MDLNVQSAQSMLSDPSADVQAVIAGASSEAQAALGDAKAALSSNGTGDNGERVQVIDEQKLFTSVQAVVQLEL